MVKTRQVSGAVCVRAGVALAGCLVLANCSSSDKLSRKVDPKYGVSASPRVVADGGSIPKGGGTYRIGKPYVVGGKQFTPHEGDGYRAEGLASWYGSDFHGRLTANGEVYDMEGISAAHPTLPMPSYVRVTNTQNRKSLIVRVNDRGPFHNNRLIDLSSKASHLLGFKGHGLARVRVEYIGPASLEGSDDRLLLATLREGAPAPAPSRVMVASAKPFMPASSEVSSSAATAGLRGAIPTPSQRPYGLGSQDTAPAPQPRVMASALPAQPMDVGLRSTDVSAARDVRTSGGVLRWQQGAEPVVSPAGQGPVSAYAPMGQGNGGYVSGRGLY